VIERGGGGKGGESVYACERARDRLRNWTNADVHALLKRL
jgi:hypothetical protein